MPFRGFRDTLPHSVEGPERGKCMRETQSSKIIQSFGLAHALKHSGLHCECLSSYLKSLGNEDMLNILNNDGNKSDYHKD